MIVLLRLVMVAVVLLAARSFSPFGEGYQLSWLINWAFFVLVLFLGDRAISNWSR